MYYWIIEKVITASGRVVRTQVINYTDNKKDARRIANNYQSMYKNLHYFAIEEHSKEYHWTKA